MIIRYHVTYINLHFLLQDGLAHVKSTRNHEPDSNEAPLGAIASHTPF
jgi:hypothetical protein